MDTSRLKKSWLFWLAAVNYFYIVDFMIVMPLGPQIIKEFNLSSTKFGLIISSYTFASGATGLLGSAFLDRMDRRKALVIFFFAFSFFTLCCGLSSNHHMLLIFRALTGAFGGLIGATILTIVSEKVPLAHRGSAMGKLALALSLASIMGVPTGVALSNLWGWRAPFLVLGVTAFVLLFFVYKSLEPMGEHLHKFKTQKRPAFWLPLYSAVSNAPERNALFFLSSVIMGQFLVIPFISPSMVANAGFQNTDLPWIYFLGGIAAFLVNPWIGKLTDFWGRGKTFRRFALFSILPILGITHMTPVGLPIALFITTLFFVGMGGRMIPTQTLMTATVSSEKRGGFLSISSATQAFSQSIAAFLAGWITTVDPDTGHLYNYQWVGYLSVALCLVALFLSRRLESYDPQK